MKKLLLFASTILLILNSNAQTFNSTLEISYGGNRADLIYDIDKSNNGSVVVAGLFGGTVDFDPGPGTYDLTSNGTSVQNNTIWGGNGFIQKFDASGNLDWAIANLTGELYSSYSGKIQEVEFDPTGNIIVKAGVPDSVDIDPGTGQILTPESVTPYSNVGVIQKLNGNTGALDWAIIIDASFRMVVDQNGDVLIAGTYQDSVDLDPGSGTFWMDPLANNSAAPFAAKYSGVDGSFLWGADFDFAATGAGINSIDVDNTGRLILGGYYRNQILVNPDAPLGSSIVFTAPNQNFNQGFMIILNSDGTHSASRNFGFSAGNNSTTTSNVAFDDLGYYYVGTTVPDLSTVIAQKLIKYDPTTNSPVWTTVIRTNYYRMDVIGDGEIYLHGDLPSGGSVDIDPSSNTISPNFTTWKPIIMKWDGSSSPVLDWYKPFGDDNLKTFVIDVSNNENISIAADFKETMTPNISSSDSFSVVTCTPNNANLCYDMYLNFAQVCSDTTFVNENLNVCSGSNYTFSDGTTYNNITANFNHTAYTTSAGGCDSAVTYAVQAVSHPITYDTAWICAGLDYTFPDGSSQTINAATDYTSNLQSSVGCDSVIETHVALDIEMDISAGFNSCQVNPNQIRVIVTDMGTINGQPSPAFQATIDGVSQTITGPGTYYFTTSIADASYQLFLFSNNCHPDVTVYNNCYQGTNYCATSSAQLIQNSNFENTVTVGWTEFATFLDSTTNTNNGVISGSNGGTYNDSPLSAWFGGYNQGSYHVITHSFFIPPNETSELSWYQRQMGACDAGDLFEVKIDGQTIFSQTADQDLYCNGNSPMWTQKKIDITPYATGGVHQFEMFYQQLGTNGYTNLFVDDVRIYSCPCPTIPTTYDTTYICSGASHTWPDGSSLNLFTTASYTSTLTSSQGCDSIVQSTAIIETVPTMSGQISCTGNTVDVTVTDMGTYQGNVAPPFDVSVEGTFYTIPGVGTYTYPLTDNMLSLRIPVFESNNCASDLWLFNTCEQSICPSNDTSNLLNGDFENATVTWTQFEAYLDSSSSGNLPITTPGFNRTYNTSTTSAWFGGWGQGSYNSISQDVVIDAGTSATLEWWQRQENGCAADDVFTVLIDGDTIFELHADQDPHCGNTGGTTPWNFKSVDVSAYADGMSHNVMFHYTQQGTNGYTNLFIDNIELYTCSAPIVQMDLPVTFDDATVLYATADFSGNSSAFVTDPTGGSNLVVQTTKSNTSLTYAGTSLEAFTPSGFLNAVPFTATETVMSVRVYSSDAGIPVLLKVEDKTNTAISVETEVMTTLTNTWETLYFDFNNNVSGTPALNLSNTYDLATIFFNFGTDGATAGTKTYYWDDVQMDSIPCPTVTSTFNDTICFFDSYTFPDGNTLTWQQLPEDTTYVTSFSTGNGCFGTAYTIVHKRPNSVGTVMFPNVCFGSDYTYPDGFMHTNVQSNLGHASVLTNQFGCDSNQLQILQVQPVYTFYDTTTLCAGVDYTAPDGTLYSNIQTTFNHTSILSSAYGCDSTHQSTVEVLPIYTVTSVDTICYNESYTFPDGNTLNNLQNDTLYALPNTAQNACDSSIYVDLYVRPNSQSANTTHTVCSGDDFTFQDGTTEVNVTSNVVHLNTFTNQYGCDSTFIQFINTVNPVYNFTQAISICYGTNYTALDGTFYGNIQADFNHTSSFTTQNGCDSNYLMAIQVAPDYTTNSSDTICYNDSYTFPDGNTLNNLQEDTLYVIPFTTWQGACDSSIYVDLHVRSNSQGVNTIHTVCNGEDFTFQDGVIETNITTNTIHLNTLTNQVGCDSTFTQEIFVNPAYSFNDTVEICQGTDFTAYDGTVYNNIQADFNHTSNLTTQNSCDSIIVTQVTVSPTYASITLDTICFNASYTFPDGGIVNNLQDDTLYVTSLTTQNGCDSIISVDLIVRPAVATTTINASICSGGSFTYIDGTVSNNITTAESYTNTFTSFLGCDSLVIENVALTPSYLVQDTFDICFGDDFTFADGTVITISNDFTYTSSLTSASSCDSIIETTITATGIAGNIQSSNAQPLANSKVYLIEYLPGQDFLFIQDSTITDINGDYFFAEGDPNHYVKAIPSASFPTDLPTYYLSSAVFQYALETSCDNALDFTTIAGQNLGGSGFVSGYIGNGSGKNSEIGEPIVELAIVIVDENGLAIARTITDVNGYFIFDDLPCGEYEIWVDDATTDNNSAPLITLENNCIEEDLQLILENDKLENQNVTSINSIHNRIKIEVYPNPTEDQVYISFEEELDEVTIEVFEIAGKKLYNNIEKNVSLLSLPLSGTKGAYFIKVSIQGDISYFKVLKI